MHGIIHLELEKFVVAGFGRGAWEKLLDRTGLTNRLYTPVQTYPDEDIVRIVSAASEMTGKSQTELLEAFGEHVVPTYLHVYGALLDSDWKTLDVIEHTEETIHRVVRMRQPGAAPPATSRRAHGARGGRPHVRLTAEALRRRARDLARHRQTFRRARHDFGPRLHAQGRSEMRDLDQTRSMIVAMP